MFQKILLVYDDSEPGERAFECTLQMVRRSRGALNIAGIVRASEFALDFAIDEALASACGTLRGKLAQLERRAHLAGLDTSSFIVIGHPAHKIVHVAAAWHADLIVTAERREGLLGHWLGHSDSRSILTRARCAVLMIR